MLKNFILKTGRKLLDFVTCVEFSLIFLAVVFLIFYIFNLDFELAQKLLYSILALFSGIVLLIVDILVKFVIYLFIEIKDNLKNDDEDDAQGGIIKTFIVALILIAVEILALTGVAIYNQNQKTILDDVNNFTVKEIKTSIKKKALYKDAIKKPMYGFSYNIDKEKFTVIDVFNDSAAQKAGLQVNDVILKVNKIDTTKMTKEKWKEVIEELNKNSMTILYQRGDVVKKMKLKRKRILMCNLNFCTTPSPYYNSFGFNDKYSFGYFKEDLKDDLYKKTGVICSCEGKKKVAPFWVGTYKGDELQKEENYLKEVTFKEIKANSPEANMCENLCFLNKDWTKKAKESYKKNRYNPVD